MNEEIKKENHNYDGASQEEPGAEDEVREKRRIRKSDFYIELALFFILGLLVGLAVKTEAAKRITIGFNDYKMKIMRQDYPINQIQKDLAQKSAEAIQQEENAAQDEEQPDFESPETSQENAGENAQ